jgi:hypothetical protein
VVVGEFNTPLSSIDRSAKQKINNEILDLKRTIDRMDLVDVYRTFHPTSTQYTFSQQPMEHSPKETISQGTEQASANIRK